jgi:enoyl-CoA hydratase/carnithine racemase
VISWGETPFLAKAINPRLEVHALYQRLLYALADGIATVTLNDPDRRNAQSREMGLEFQDLVGRLKRDESVQVLIVTGAGKAFCAGGDLDMLAEMLDRDAESNRRTMADFYEYFLCVTELEIPTITAINGAAIGAGASWALGFDLRLAADGAQIGFTYVNLGLHPGMGTHFLLPRLIGTARAYELVATGRIITAAEAERIGLINQVVPLSELMPAAQRLAQTLKAQPQGTLRTAKQSLYQGLRDGLRASLQADAVAQSMSFTSEEMRNRVTALRARIAGPSGGR